MSADWPERAACRLSDLADPGALEFTAGDDPAAFRGVVVRRGAGVYAYANACPHKGHALNGAADGFLATVAGGVLLRCASHDALFVPESGLCVAGPCSGRSLRALPCRVADDVVWVRAPAA